MDFIKNSTHYAYTSQRGTQSRIYTAEEVPAWDSSELYGFENVCIGSIEECKNAIASEFERRGEA